MKWLLATAVMLSMALHAHAQPASEVPQTDAVALWETATRAHINAVLRVIPTIPAEVVAAAARVRADVLSHGYAPLFIIFAALSMLGLAGEWIYKRQRQTKDGPLSSLLPVAVFAGSMAVVFFAVDWPPLARIVLLIFLIAVICYRAASVTITLGYPTGGGGRARLMVASVILAVACAAAGRSTGVAPDAVVAMSALFSVLLLALALEAAWSQTGPSRTRKTATMLAVVGVWILWCLGLKILFWLGVFAFALPPLLRSVGRAASAYAPLGIRGILIGRGARALVIVAATGWLAFVWKINPDGLGHDNPEVTAIFFGLLKSVVVVLLADLLWQVSKFWITEVVAGSSETPGLSSEEAARRGRLRTLLPILRNALAVVILVMTVLVVLAELGVEIGPLLAGAGIFGVALGFGSQALVKDVISGVFYMFDDAFRVGEYIQAKNYKGTVEGFSLRSVRLRHHRGPVFTVPFGDLGAVENMSRDWGVVKFRIAVDFSADLEKARKLTKKIGQTLLEDAELGPLFIEPLKMKGLEEFGEYGLVLSFGMMLKPSPMQSFIRRRANLMLREAFIANGIDFATPSVQVGGGDKEAAAAAAVAGQARQEKAAALSGD